VPKEAQEDALSDDTTGGRQTPTGRPTRGNVSPFTVFFLAVVLVLSRGGGVLELFLGCRTSGKEVIPTSFPFVSFPES
jgi:hypothetical protein